MSNHRAELVAAISKAATFAEQAARVTELDEYDAHLRSEAAAARELDLAGAVVTQTLTPVRTHEMHTAATDWIGDFEPVPDDTTNAHHASIAEAAMWYSRVSPEVKADIEEFGIQAEGFMRREASRHGEQAQAVYDEGLAYLGFLYRRQAASGLDQVQQTVNPHEDNAPTPLPPDVFDNFAPPVSPFNDATVGTETSERNPLLQEIEQAAGGQGQPEKPGGHSTDDEVSYPDQPADAATGPLDMDAIGGEGEGQPEQPGGHSERMASQRSWEGRSVAISHTMNLDDFAALQAREAASGLDQVQQTIDPHDNPSPTPLPEQVMFPWLISQDAYGTQGAEPEGEVGQDAADVANSPNPYKGQKQAGYEPVVHPKGSKVFVRHWSHADTDEEGNPGFYANVLAEPGQHGDPERPEEHLMEPSSGRGTPFYHHFGARKQAGAYDPTDDPSSWQWDKSAHPGGPGKGTPDDLFPNGVPLHGDLSDEQQAWMDKGRKKQSGRKSDDYYKGYTDHANGEGGPLVVSDSDAEKESPRKSDDYYKGYTDHANGTTSTRKTADMWGNSDAPHAVPGPSPANSPGTQPNEKATYQEGYKDAQSGQRPTFADASSGAPSNVSQYAQGYSDGKNAEGQGQGGSMPPQSNPVSLGGDNGQNVTNGDLNSDIKDLSAAAAHTAAQVVYHESYGEVTRPQLAAYRKHNVSPSDHDYLTDHYGEDAHDAITKAVKDPANHSGRSFSTYKHQDNFNNENEGHPGGSTGWGRISSRFVKSASRKDPEFTKGYGYGSKWEPGKPLVTLGSAEFEAGLFAGMIDRPKHQQAWVDAHRRQASKDPRFDSRMSTYSSYVDYLEKQGISLVAYTDEDTLDAIQRRDPDGNSPTQPTQADYQRHKDWAVSTHGQAAWDRYKNNEGWGTQPGDEPRHVESGRKQAGTSSDLDTMDTANTSPSPTGQTPINGRGEPGPLDGQQDPAAPGGPSPYNGADPFGHQVVPSVPTPGGGGSNYVNDIPGGPADGNVNPATLAFRRQVQASLLQQSRKG